jgi:hypothetical protein
MYKYYFDDLKGNVESVSNRTFEFIFIMGKNIIFFVILLLVTACSKRHKITFHQNFDQFSGWTDMSGIVKGKGYSGDYFTRTGEGRDYSRTFSMKLGDISEKSIRRIDMGAWIRISEPGASAKLVLSIESGDSTVYWQGLESVGISPKPGEWSRLYFTYDIPAGFEPDFMVKVFLWNQSRKEVDADDFDIHFYTR